MVYLVDRQENFIVWASMNECGETTHVETTNDISLAKEFFDEEDARDFKSAYNLEAWIFIPTSKENVIG